MYIYKKSLGFISTIGEERERDPLTPPFFVLFPPASPFSSLSIARLGYFESEPHFLYLVVDGKICIDR